MTQHVWHQGRKVTGLSDRTYGRHVYVSGRGYVYQPPMNMEQIRRQRAANARKHAPPTIGRSTAIPVINVASACTGWFRLVDAHGKPHGRRYTRTARWREDPAKRGWGWVGNREYLCFDQFGTETWVKGSARARYVAKQPEDYHSYASRVLKRAHKQEA